MTFRVALRQERAAGEGGGRRGTRLETGEGRSPSLFRKALVRTGVNSPLEVSPAVRQFHPEAGERLQDSWNLEFLGISETDVETDLHLAPLGKLKDLATCHP